MKNFLKENWFKIIAALALIIIAISIAYHFIILPNKISSAQTNKVEGIDALPQNTISSLQPIQDAQPEIPNNKQGDSSATVSTSSTSAPKEDPQIKIEKCKAIAEKQANAYATAIAQINQHLAGQINEKYANAIAASSQTITQQDLNRLKTQKDQELASSQALVSGKLNGAIDVTQSDEYLKCLNK